MASKSSPIVRPSSGPLTRRFDLWLWGLFGHGARLAARRSGRLTALLTALGLALPR